MQALLNQFEQALISLDRIRAEELFEQALSERTPIEVVDQLVVPAFERIGSAWEDGTLALSQIYMSGRFGEELVERVLPPSDPERRDQPRSAIVVLEDYHMLGKRIVYSLMRASGYELFDYGRMTVDELVGRVQSDGVRVLLISVLMLPSALKVRDLRERLNAADRSVKIAVGGAPFLFDDQLWREVGADAMGRTASDAIAIARQWMGETR